ncbi:hypothetical protein A9Q81_06790 [Gammaproteobacteria bacterium 42_54_T18]|nr:hypothetical protein A9Q81_06790 [Gammaproteobacteria bacterium 42_54_T18]
MYKGILFVGLIYLLVGCGGGGPSSGSEVVGDNNLTEDVDPYLGKWERNCIPVETDSPIYEDEMEPFVGLYWSEKITINTDSIHLKWELFDDSGCDSLSGIFADLMEIIDFENLGGEILEKNALESAGGWEFIHYYVVDESVLTVHLIDVHLVDDRLYKVEFTGDVDEGAPLGEGYTVNFNKYYTRVLD